MPSNTKKDNQLGIQTLVKELKSGKTKTYYNVRGIVTFKSESKYVKPTPIGSNLSEAEIQKRLQEIEVKQLKELKDVYLKNNAHFTTFGTVTNQMLNDHMATPNSARHTQYEKNSKYLASKLVSEITQLDITQVAFKRYPKLLDYKGKKLSHIYNLKEREKVSGWFSTANTNVMIPVGKVLHYAHRLGICPYIKLQYFETENTRNRRKIKFTLQEIKDCMKHDDFQIVLLFTFLFFTGCRVSEALRIHWLDIDNEDKKVVDLENNKIRIFQNKTGTWRTVPIHQSLSKVIESVEDKTGYLFEWRHYRERKNTHTGLIPRWQKMLDAANIKEFKGRHALRHTLASMLSDSGASTQEIMTYIGWTDQRSALRYAGTSHEKLKVIINSLNN